MQAFSICAVATQALEMKQKQNIVSSLLFVLEKLKTKVHLSPLLR